MRIIIDRFIARKEFIIGKVLIDGELFCYSLELPWENNKPRESCIPTGKYECKPYSSARYTNVVELQGVKDRSRILIHAGNYTKDTLGCILLGDSYDESKGAVWNSKTTLSRFFDKVGYNFTVKIKGDNMSITGILATKALSKIGKPIFSKLKGKAKEMALEKLGGILGSKFNINNDADLDKLDADALRELEVEAQKIELGIEKEYTKQTKIVHDTMQKELTAPEKMQRTWRPFVGYCFGFCASMLITTICLITVISVLKGGETISDLSLLLANISGLVTIVFGALGGVCGAIGYGRSKEKIAGKQND